MIRPTDTDVATMPWFDLRREAERARAAESGALGRVDHLSRELHRRLGHDGTWEECQKPGCAEEREMVSDVDTAPIEPRCSGCQRAIDPTTCWCGSPVDGHGYSDTHSPVPMGCECHRGGNHAAD